MKVPRRMRGISMPAWVAEFPGVKQSFGRHNRLGMRDKGDNEAECAPGHGQVVLKGLQALVLTFI